MREAAQKVSENSGAKMTETQRYNLLNERLDKQIEFRTAMKEILSDNQFEKWSKSSRTNEMKRRKAMRSRSENRGEAREARRSRGFKGHRSRPGSGRR
jgi:hypothetical protein